jgi:hypothetical protein
LLPGSSQLTDSTDNPNGRSRARLLAQVVTATIIVALAAGSFATSARADGDPASDVLATQPLFLPQDASIPLAQQNQVTALLAAAASSGYQLRVAIIASAADLGSVTELWHQPQTYARFLGQELSLVYHGPLLVIMPNGFGLESLNSAAPANPSALAGVRIQAGGAGLATVALTAIQRLADASGHSVPIPPATATTTASGSGDTIAVIAFAIGAALIGRRLERQPSHPSAASTPATHLFDLGRYSDCRNPLAFRVTGSRLAALHQRTNRRGSAPDSAVFGSASKAATIEPSS